MQQYNGRTIKHAFSWLWAMRVAWGRRIHKSNRPWVTYKNWKKAG
jgi:hypothetical protein